MEGQAANPHMMPTAVFSGTAKEGSIGPHIGVLDIGVSDGAYIFRVAVPGVERGPNKLKFQVQHSGRVHIEGQIASGVPESSSPYQLMDQQLSPPGPFSVSFNLPGPVDTRLITPIFRHDGILEAVVMKSKKPEVQAV